MPADLIKPRNLPVARKFACSRGHALTNLYIHAVEAPALIHNVSEIFNGKFQFVLDKVNTIMKLG